MGRASAQAYCNSPEAQAKYQKTYRAKQAAKGLCRTCPNPAAAGRTSCELHLALKNAKSLGRRQKLIAEVFAHYGNRCACPGCSITEPAFLTIDHIDGGGRRHRDEVGSGHEFYVWIIENNFPKTLQLLCANCNLGKMRCGECPGH